MLVCKICKTSPTCAILYDATMYCIRGIEDMNRTCIHIQKHKHLIAFGDYKETIIQRNQLIGKQV